MLSKQQIEQREKAMERSWGVCVVCGKPLREGAMQYAHKISNKEIWRKKYGTFIIDHTLNGELVCSLACNQSIDVGSSYGNHLDVIADVLISEYIATWGAEGLGKLTDKVLVKYKRLGIALK